jgi:hypothetical protein
MSESTALQNGLLRGVVQPDLQYVPKSVESLPAGVILDTKRVLDWVNSPIDRVEDWVKSATWEVGKNIGQFTSSLGGLYDTGLYEGMKQLRNWWQDSDFIPDAVVGIDSGLEGAGAEGRLSDNKMYQTHYGETAWKHAMTNGKLTAVEMQDIVVNHAASLIEQFRGSVAAGREFDGGFSLGEAVHLLQDSHSKSHVARDENGLIERFQFYGAQSPTRHGDADDIEIGESEFNAVRALTEEFMAVASNRPIFGDALRESLRERFFKLAPRAEAGGSARAFEPRNPK